MVCLWGGIGTAAHAQYEPRIPANYDAVIRAQERADARSPAGAAQTPARVAAEPNKRGRWYAGAAYGSSGFQASVAEAQASIFSTGATTVSVTGHGYDRMWKAYVGYAFSPRFALEAGYWNFGGPRYSAEVTAPVSTTFQRSFSARGVGIDGVAWHPLGESFWVFGKLGGMLTSTRAEGVDPGGGLAPLGRESKTTLNPHWGFGVTYAVNPDWRARLEYENVHRVGDAARFGTANIHSVSLGMTVGF